MRKSITAIVPFLNEEKFLEKSVNRLLEIDLFEEIILVDDASTDDSVEIASELSNKYANISLIKLKNQSGKVPYSFVDYNNWFLDNTLLLQVFHVHSHPSYYNFSHFPLSSSLWLHSSETPLVY